MGTFDDDDMLGVLAFSKIVALLLVLPWAAVWLLGAAACSLSTQPAKSAATQWQRFRGIVCSSGSFWCVWPPLLLLATVMASSYHFNSNPLLLNGSGTLFGGIAPTLFGPAEYANGKWDCPEPGTCVHGETDPKDCRCEYKEPFSVARFMVPGGGGSNSVRWFTCVCDCFWTV